jgi:predicted  nucleic acid-binding Zn-ribbon protein
MPDREAIWGKVKDLLVIIVIPAAIWITSSILELRESRAAAEQKAEYLQRRALEAETKINILHDKAIRLENVQRDVVDLTSTIGTMTTKDNSLEVKVSTLETKIESMGDDIKEIKSMVKTLVKTQ